MLKRVVLSVLAASAVAILTLVAWAVLQRHQSEQIAKVAETESYAARSQLIRNVDTMLRALREVRDYWDRYGHLPREQWATDAAIEQSHFAGLELILWNDEARGKRYVRNTDHPVFDYRPDDDEWATYAGFLKKVADAHGEAILGPFVDNGNGKVTVEVYVVSSEPDSSGSLVAVIDTNEAFADLLRDESPGYALSVLWKGIAMYQRGVPATDIPESWRREGMIETTMGTLWRVVHAPTAALVKSFRTPAVTGVLICGLAVSVLMGLLTFENARARSRAAAAEVAEKKLADLNHDLESQIGERTAELAARSTDLETITDSVAHDLRNPLNTISVNTQLLQQQYAGVLGQDGIDALERTSSGVRRMTEILNRLLGLSVVSHATFNPQQVEMEEVVREVFDELSASEQPPRPELEVGRLPPAQADLTLVRTLVMNLLSNAIKYTRDKDVRRVEVRAEQRDGVTIYSVRDNGVGFDPQLRTQLFRAFKRLDNGSKSDGLGLGLDIAARVVRRHGGVIWADSGQGDGAIFRFTLQPGYEPG